MKLDRKYTIDEISKITNCEYIGNKNIIADSIEEIHSVTEGSIIFVDNEKYYKKSLQSPASLIIIDQKIEFPEDKALLISSKPFETYNNLVKYFNKDIEFNIDQKPKIGKGTIIYPNTTIDSNVVLGENCIIYPGVVIYRNTIIGDNVIIHANTVLGADAFYYNTKENIHRKMNSCGGVIIEDNVEIGASCTIDKGVSNNTIIGKGAKIDDHVHIGHETKIGKNCIIAALVGIAGCVTVEDNVKIWGQVGIASDIIIGENSIVLGQSGVSKDLEANKTYFGTPAQDYRTEFKQKALIRKLPEILNLNE